MNKMHRNFVTLIFSLLISVYANIGYANNSVEIVNIVDSDIQGLEASLHANINNNLMLKNVFSEAIEITKIVSGTHVAATNSKKPKKIAQYETFITQLRPGSCPTSHEQEKFINTITVTYKADSKELTGKINIECSCSKNEDILENGPVVENLIPEQQETQTIEQEPVEENPIPEQQETQTIEQEPVVENPTPEQQETQTIEQEPVEENPIPEQQETQTIEQEQTSATEQQIAQPKETDPVQTTEENPEVTQTEPKQPATKCECALPGSPKITAATIDAIINSEGILPGSQKLTNMAIDAISNSEGILPGSQKLTNMAIDAISNSEGILPGSQKLTNMAIDAISNSEGILPGSQKLTNMAIDAISNSKGILPGSQKLTNMAIDAISNKKGGIPYSQDIVNTFTTWLSGDKKNSGKPIYMTIDSNHYQHYVYPNETLPGSNMKVCLTNQF